MTIVPKIVVCCAVALSGVAARASAEPIQLFAAGGEVSVFFAGSEAEYRQRLFLSQPDFQGPFFPNHETAPGSGHSLGTFSAGTELQFMLDVLDTGYQFFTGPASANPDGIVHAIGQPFTATSEIPTSGVLIGFEDIFGGGDQDFNDFMFVVSNATTENAAAVPEPATVLLLGSAAAAAYGMRRKRRKAPIRR